MTKSNVACIASLLVCASLALTLRAGDPENLIVVKGGITQVTYGSQDSRVPQIDAKGGLVAFSRSRTLILQDLKTDGVTIVAADVTDPDVSDGGTAVVFISDSDPIGRNADGNNEIFFRNMKTASLVQVTSTVDDKGYESPTVDQSGKKIAFISTADFAGMNGDDGRDIFLYDVKSGAYVMVTNADDAEPYVNRPVITAAGKHVFYDSTFDHTGENPDGIRQIFRYDVQKGTTEQLTSVTEGACASPSPSKNGQYVAFLSSSPELAGANDDGLDEAYVLKVSDRTIVRVTDSDVDVLGVSLAGNGRYVAFGSRGDFVAGSNADGSPEAFLARLLKDGAEIVQLTSGSASTNTRRPLLNGTGTRCVFESSADLTGDGGEIPSNQVFVWSR